ncbi:hypothetical protein SVIOM74S_09957 [Streptomyces violarus]
MDEPGRAGLRVHRQIPLTALVTGLHQQQRGGPRTTSAPGPGTGTPPGTRPTSVRSPSRSMTKSRTSASGVPGRRVGDLGRLALGVCRIGDVPPLYGALVGPRDQQPVRLGRPPETPVAVHLLGRDELGQTIGDLGVLRLGQRPVALARRVHHPQRALGHVRGCPGRGGRAGVDHRTRHRQRPRGPGPQLGHVHLSGQRERGQLRRRVHRVGDDPRRTLPGPLPPGPLLRRQLLRETPSSASGSAAIRSSPVAGSSTQSRVVRSVPDVDRRKITRVSSGETVKARGAPRVKRWVRAC